VAGCQRQVATPCSESVISWQTNSRALVQGSADQFARKHSPSTRRDLMPPPTPSPLLDPSVDASGTALSTVLGGGCLGLRFIFGETPVTNIQRNTVKQTRTWQVRHTSPPTVCTHLIRTQRWDEGVHVYTFSNKSCTCWRAGRWVVPTCQHAESEVKGWVRNSSSAIKLAPQLLGRAQPPLRAGSRTHAALSVVSENGAYMSRILARAAAGRRRLSSVGFEGVRQLIAR
jgi:hypothetical protein